MKKIIFLIFVMVMAFSGCKGEEFSEEPSKYVAFTQTVRGLITGMTNINGTLNLKKNTSVSVDLNVPVHNGSFSITKEMKLEATNYDVTLTTVEGITMKVPGAVLNENSLTFPVTKRRIDNVIEKEEAMRIYISSKDPEQLTAFEKMLLNWHEYAFREILPAKKRYLEQEHREFIDEGSQNSFSNLNETREQIQNDIDHMESNQYSLMEAYITNTTGNTCIWLKPPTIVIYDRSVWSWKNGKWEIRSDLQGQMQYPEFLTRGESFYSLCGYQYFQGLTNAPFTILKESAGDTMPNPAIMATSGDATHYIFFLINDGQASFDVFFRGIYGEEDTYAMKALRTSASVPYNMEYNDVNMYTLRLMLFWSLKVSTYRIPLISFVDSDGTPNMLMILIGKIKNHRDPGHQIILENGEYIDKSQQAF